MDGKIEGYALNQDPQQIYNTLKTGDWKDEVNPLTVIKSGKGYDVISGGRRSVLLKLLRSGEHVQCLCVSEKSPLSQEQLKEFSSYCQKRDETHMVRKLKTLFKTVRPEIFAKKFRGISSLDHKGMAEIVEFASNLVTSPGDGNHSVGFQTGDPFTSNHEHIHKEDKDRNVKVAPIALGIALCLSDDTVCGLYDTLLPVPKEMKKYPWLAQMLTIGLITTPKDHWKSASFWIASVVFFFSWSLQKNTTSGAVDGYSKSLHKFLSSKNLADKWEAIQPDERSNEDPPTFPEVARLAAVMFLKDFWTADAASLQCLQNINVLDMEAQSVNSLLSKEETIFSGKKDADLNVNNAGGFPVTGAKQGVATNLSSIARTLPLLTVFNQNTVANISRSLRNVKRVNLTKRSSAKPEEGAQGAKKQEKEENGALMGLIKLQPLGTDANGIHVTRHDVKVLTAADLAAAQQKKTEAESKKAKAKEADAPGKVKKQRKSAKAGSGVTQGMKFLTP